MDYSKEIGSIIAYNLRELRRKKDLSLDTLASLSSVSKSMLGQIERGESSPTVTTLWKIATALHVSFTSLLEDTKKEVVLIDNNNLTPICNEEKLFKLFPTFPYEHDRNFEMFYIVLEPNAVSPSAPHDIGTEEFIIVYEGSLEVEVNNKKYHLNSNCAIRYDADSMHSYRNTSDTQTRICMVINYK